MLGLVQANVRGFLLRKKNKFNVNDVDAKPQLSNRSKKMFGGGDLFSKKGKANFGVNSYARELAEMSDHSNSATRETEQRLGPFIFDQV